MKQRRSWRWTYGWFLALIFGVARFFGDMYRGWAERKGREAGDWLHCLAMIAGITGLVYLWPLIFTPIATYVLCAGSVVLYLGAMVVLGAKSRKNEHLDQEWDESFNENDEEGPVAT